MAQSKVERVGSIFSRMSALIKGGAMPLENTPLWVEVYKAFPPMYEPRFERPVSEKPIRPIFYEEDLIRAKFYKDVKPQPIINLSSEKNTEIGEFLDMYQSYLKFGVTETEAYNNALKEYRLQYSKENKNKDSSKS